MSLELTINRDLLLGGFSEIVTFKPEGTSSQQKKVMGDNIVSLQFTLNQIINFNIGDWTIVFGEKYFLARSAVVTKTSTYKYIYQMQMVSLQYDLSKAQYMFYDSNNELREGDFSVTGTADIFIDLLIKNVNRLNPGWTKGGVVATETKTITFSKEDCGSALAHIAKEFDTEYYISALMVHLDKIYNATPYRFQYGDGKGLYEIKRQEVDNTSVITRLYVFGSDKNLPPDYPSSRLRLSGGYDNLVHNVTWNVTGTTYTFFWDLPLGGIDDIVVEYRRLGTGVWFRYDAGNVSTVSINFGLPGTYLVRFSSYIGTVLIATTSTVLVTTTNTTPVLTSATALPYLEKNTDLYGIIEANYINEDIYPHRTGVVTAVDATDIYTFSDSTIDFNVNTQLLPGLTPKITFNTGQLAGYTFDVSSFDNSLKQFTILKNKDEKALDIPSALIKPLIGDQYVLVDIEMPASYVQAAEALLLQKAQAYLDLYSTPIYQYTIVCDPKWFRAKVIKMNIGDVVWITDTELQISKYIRVISLTKSLIDEFDYTLDLGDVVPIGTLQQIVSNQVTTQGGVDSVTNRVNNNSLLEGYFIGPTAPSTAGMKGLFADSTGKIWKEP